MLTGTALAPSTRGSTPWFRWLALWSMVMMACSPGPEKGSVNSIAVLTEGDERIFGPFWSMSAWFMMFLPLVQIDESGEMGPRLAKSWEHSADLREWTFHLRSDVAWHDGVPTTAHDIKFTLELQALPDIRFDDAWHDVDSMLVVDDTTLTIHYRNPKDALNDWMVYWPKHLLEDLDPTQFWDWDFWVNPVGNGPYRYVRHMPKTVVELEANPDFFAGKPAIDHVLLKFGNTSGLTELLSGNVDILSSGSAGEVHGVASDPRFERYHSMHPAIPWLTALVWNNRHPFLAESSVRRALTMAIDRRELLRLLDLPTDLRLTDVPFTPTQYYQDRIPDMIEHDPTTAGALLANHGWIDSDGDGILDRNGEPFRFELLIFGEFETEAVYVQEALRRIGVEMVIQPLARQVVSSRTGSGSYAAALFPFWNHVDGHINWYGGSDQAGDSDRVGNVTGYSNPRVRRLLQAIRSTVDVAERDSLYAEVAPILLEDLPLTLLVPTVQTVVARSTIRGLKSPFMADPMMQMERLWLEQ